VVALVGEAPLRTEGLTSKRLQSDFFLDRVAVASPQWENGLTLDGSLINTVSERAKTSNSKVAQNQSKVLEL
jgi:hypothetical protein